MSDGIDCGIRFPGLVNLTGNGQVTLSHGTRPSVFTLEVAENQSVASVGQLLLTENGQTVIAFNDCAVDGIFRSSDDETRFTVRILDRRWKWQVGGDVISFHWNMRNPNKTIREETAKSPREMLEILFLKLNEAADLSLVPDTIDQNTTPELEGDHVRPAQAIEELVNKLGCRVVLGTDDIVKVWPAGFGSDLPFRVDRIADEQDSIESTAIPDGLLFVAAPTIWQGLLKLIPKGLDLDGKIKAIDALSYVPEGGWEAWPIANPDVGVTYGKDDDEKKKAKQLAKQTVWKWFGIVGQANGLLGPVPEVSFEINELWQYQLRSELLDTAENEDGSFSHLKPFAVGQWADPSLEEEQLEANGNTRPDTTFEGGISIDANNNIVQFPQEMFKFDDSENGYAKPDLWVYCSYHLADPETRQAVRYTKEQQFPVTQRNTGFQPVRATDVQLTVKIQNTYENGSYTQSGTTINHEDMEQAASYYLTNKQKELVPETGKDVSYGGFVNVNLNGAIAQVSWTWRNGVGMTRASRNTEHSLIVPRYKERLRATQLDTIMDKIEALQQR